MWASSAGICPRANLPGVRYIMTALRPDLTIVVCSYNRALQLTAALDTLNRQTIRERLEVVVVDDGSTPPIEEREVTSRGARLIRHPVNLGAAAARNTGFSASRAPIVAFTDDDCRPSPEWADALLSAYLDPRVAAAGGPVVERPVPDCWPATTFTTRPSPTSKQNLETAPRWPTGCGSTLGATSRLPPTKARGMCTHWPAPTSHSDGTSSKRWVALTPASASQERTTTSAFGCVAPSPITCSAWFRPPPWSTSMTCTFEMPSVGPASTGTATPETFVGTTDGVRRPSIRYPYSVALPSWPVSPIAVGCCWRCPSLTFGASVDTECVPFSITRIAGLRLHPAPPGDFQQCGLRRRVSVPRAVMTIAHHHSGKTTAGLQRLALIAVLAGLLVIGVAIQAGGTLLRDAGVLAAPQQYLALSLDNLTSLPSQVAPGDPVQFRFTISSTRTSTVDQKWTVVLSSANTKQLVAQGVAKVGAGATVTIPVSFAMPQQASGDVTVSIGAPGGGMAPLQFHMTTGAS